MYSYVYSNDVYPNACTPLHVHADQYTRAYTTLLPRHTDTHKHIHIHTRIYVYIYIYIHIHMRAQIHIPIHLHAQILTYVGRGFACDFLFFAVAKCRTVVVFGKPCNPQSLKPYPKP